MSLAAVGLAALHLGTLAAVRWWALLRVQVHWREALGAMWWPASVVLALILAVLDVTALHPNAVDVVWPGPPLSPTWLLGGLWLLLWEFVLGTVLGHVLALVGHVLLGTGATGAKLLRVAPAPWSALVLTWTLALVMALGLHQPLLFGASRLGELFALGQPAQWWAGTADWLPAMVSALAGLLLVALSLVTPILLSATLAELLGAVVGQGPGSGATLAQAVAPTLRLAMALVALGSSWQIHGEVWARAVLP